MEDFYEDNYINFFFKKKNLFPQNRKSIEYKRINKIRSNLLKTIDKETSNYLKQKTMINSKSSEYYLKTIFPNTTINLKTKHIKSNNQNKKDLSFNVLRKFTLDDNNLFDIIIHPYLFESYHHYIKLKSKKKLKLAKNANSKLGSDSCLLISSALIENDLSPYKERYLYKLMGQISQKTYFNYLHSLFLSLHKKRFNSMEPTKYVSSTLKDYSKEYEKMKKKFS
jgi:hypothetical protein